MWNIIVAWNREYETWRARYPSVAELSRAHGDATNTRLYDSRSIIRKRCALHDGTRSGA